jgi:hypothetical protein
MRQDTALFYALGMHAEIVREGNSASPSRARRFGDLIEKAYLDEVCRRQNARKVEQE